VHQNKLYHLGVHPICRSTLAYANEHRNCRIYEALFDDLLPLCKDKIGHQRKFHFKNKLYALDSTTIDLCLSLFPWATFRQKKGAIKLHHLFDVQSQIPEFMVMTTGKVSDITAARKLDFSDYLDSIIVFDRGYEDFKWWAELDGTGVLFVTRLQKNVQYRILGQQKIGQNKHIRRVSLKEDGVLRDETIELTGVKAKDKYAGKLRLVTYYDKVHEIQYQFVTNIFHLSAKTIANIYKARWDIEIFFKWIKQNLRIKTFLGTSRNAVLTQVWIAMIYYLLLMYIKYQTKYSGSLAVLTLVVGEMYYACIPFIDLLSPKYMSRARASPQYPLQLAFL
jgi:hypothetical protein